MLRKIFFRFFWNTYDNLGGWLLLSGVGFVLSLPLVSAPAVWGAMFGAAARADREHEISLRFFWSDLRYFGRRSSILGAILLVGLILWISNLYFYSTSSLVVGMPPFLRIALLCFFFWAGLFGLIGLDTAWAFMVMQDLPVKKALKRGFLVLAAQPIASLATMLMIGIVLATTAVSVLGAIVLLGGLHANLVMGLAAGAVEYYDELEERKERQRLEREGARSWHEMRVLDERAATRYRRYDRGWKDILRPWEMR